MLHTLKNNELYIIYTYITLISKKPDNNVTYELISKLFNF